MKRGLLAVVIVLTGAVSYSSADYLIIIANLGLTKQEVGYPPMGGIPGPGGIGGPGGAGANPPGRPGYPGGGMGPGGNPAGRPGYPGGGRPGFPNPAGRPGYPGGGMGPGRNPNGFGGGMARPGGLGMAGGVPGGYSFIAAAGEESPPVLVISVVEIEHGTVRTRTELEYGIPVMVKHPWGKSHVISVATRKYGKENSIYAMIIPMPSTSHRFNTESKRMHNGKVTADQLLALARRALRDGLIKECATVMQELSAMDKNHPSAIAFQTVQKALAERPTSDASIYWKKELLQDYKIATSDHYALLHQAGKNDSPIVSSRLALLEDAYRAFFYWFALNGKVLQIPDRHGTPQPLPDHRLVNVLVPSEEEFNRYHKVFDSLPLATDGFFSRRDQLVVSSLSPLDPGSKNLASMITATLQVKGQDRDRVVKGKWTPHYGDTTSLQELCEIQTYALLQKALEEDSEIATTSYEGTLQLLTAAGLTPRNVAVPQWYQFGMGSFFSTPKGAPWRNVGGPSPSMMHDHNYLLQYQEWSKDKKDEKVAQVLKKVVTDEYFREAERPLANPKTLLKARSMAWALIYFLAQAQDEQDGGAQYPRYLDGLMRYSKELAKMPRDLEFDSDTLLLCFAKAFGLLDDKDPHKVDENKLTRLADRWDLFVRSASLIGQEILKELEESQHKMTHSPVTPGNNSLRTPAAGGLGDGTGGALGPPSAKPKPPER